MNNARTLEQSVITIDIHWSSRESWWHGSSTSNPNSWEASWDLLQEQRGNHEAITAGAFSAAGDLQGLSGQTMLAAGH